MAWCEKQPPFNYKLNWIFFKENFIKAAQLPMGEVAFPPPLQSTHTDIAEYTYAHFIFPQAIVNIMGSCYWLKIQALLRGGPYTRWTEGVASGAKTEVGNNTN